jgi:hypothetical protein
LKINLSLNLFLFSLILAFFLMSICMSVSGVVAEENPGLPESKLVEVASLPPKYEAVSGMVKNGSEVSITVVLTNFSREIEGNKSELFFHSDLEDPVWGISIDGSPEECSSPFTVDHRKVGEARITLAGKAPEVKKRTEDKITLLNITQKIKKEYSVLCLKEYVTSEIAEDALGAWHKADEEIENANWTIANATKAGIDVEEAERAIKLANEHLNNSLDFYNSGRPEEALREAELASVSAGDAKEIAKGAKVVRKTRDIIVMVAIVIIAVVVLGLWAKKRSKKRGIY